MKWRKQFYFTQYHLKSGLLFTEWLNESCIKISVAHYIAHYIQV
jgi:hypothetical protein